MKDAEIARSRLISLSSVDASRSVSSASRLTCAASASDLKKLLPLLHLLDAFGLVSDGHLPALKKEMPLVCLNSRPFSAVARPTPAGAALGERVMWSQRCRLRFKL